MDFIKLENLKSIGIGFKQLQQSGQIVYEYNPLKVMRVQNSNEITDLDTEKLNFDLNHPVDIITQPSYDGTVNLILNDGKNPPRMINSRFTTTGLGTYKIIDRFGDNETNIYDEETLEEEISLFKLNNNIVKLEFLGLQESGNLKVGNYHFYFKLQDADGNETDFIAESSVVSCFIGNTNDLSSIRGGVEDESTYKSALFQLTNIDSEYNSVSVYYTRASGTIGGLSTVTAHKLVNSFPISDGKCNVLVTGFEQDLPISVDELNITYHTIETAKTQTDNSSMLFFGNTTDTTINYKELQDLSLRFTPSIYNEDDIGYVDHNYEDTSVSNNPNEYYNPLNIYYRLGYWDDEIYRFGIVYIFNNGDLSPVFNVRGINILNSTTKFKHYPLYNENGIRNYIPIDEHSFDLPDGENTKGVIKIEYKDTFSSNVIKPCGIKFSATEDVRKELKTLGIKGLFFVRQKRMKSTLCQAIPIGFDPRSKLPLIPVLDGEKTKYLYESFISKDKVLTHSYEHRARYISQNSIKVGQAALCPEYELDQGYFNNFFTGSKLKLETKYSIENNYFNQDSKYKYHYYLDKPKYNEDKKLLESYIVGVPDNTKYISNKEELYSSMAGDVADPTIFAYMEYENKNENATNIVRGPYGTYIGLEHNINIPLSVVNIKIPGYNPNVNYFEFRYRDDSPFFAISERLSLDEFKSKRDNSTRITYIESPGIYRGDCFICNFSHRMIRNFSDTETPTNDVILDKDCWKDNYTIGKTDSDKDVAKINRSDVNAVKIGHWVTFKLCSNYNLSLRSHDNSFPVEYGLTGNYRSFYPYGGLNLSGSAKLPESQAQNAGYNKTVSEQNRFNQRIVPAIKNFYHTRIYYSDVAVNNAFENGYRVFKNDNYVDYPLEYGSLMKLVSWGGYIMAIFEHGIAQLAINEKATIASTTGDTSFLSAGSVLPDTPYMLTDSFGTQWPESVIQTPYAIYGVDTVAKKIWRIALTGTLNRRYTVTTISDFKVQKFLNDNISLGEHETTPIIGIRNVKSHYNAFKNEVMFTFYDDLNAAEEKVWNLCYNETLDKFTTFYSWVPSYSANIDNIFFTFDRDSSKRIAKKSIKDNQVIVASNYRLIDTNESLPFKPISLPEFLLLNGELVNGSIAPEEFTIYGINTSVNDPSQIVFAAKSESELGNKFYTNFKGREKYQQLKYNGVVLNKGVIFIDQDTEIQYISEDGKALKEFDKSKDKIFVAQLNVNLQPYKDSIGGTNKIYDSSVKYNYEILDGVYSVMFSIENDNELYLNMNLYNNFINSERNYVEVVTLPIKATVNKSYNSEESSDNMGAICEYYSNLYFTHPNYDQNLEKTYFWKHGQAGLMQLKSDIKPCLWYGKQHPFEFEFVVVDNASLHKIFTNLEIISNNVAPESLHFEIDGEVYNFADDKKNMFFRQEALKHLYQHNGVDISFDKNYLEIMPEQRDIPYSNNSLYKDKSVSFPIYYGRVDTINEIEDFYQSKSEMGKDYHKMSGSEILYDKTMNTFRIATHIKGCPFGRQYTRTIHPDVYFANSKYPNFKCNGNITYILTYPTKTEVRKSSTLEEFIKEINNSNWVKTNEGYISSNNGTTITNIEGFYEICTYGRLNGNMSYNEDVWRIQIPSIVYKEKNELVWPNGYPTLNIVNNPAPETANLLNNNDLNILSIPKQLKDLGYNFSNAEDWIDYSVWKNRKETRLRDKYLRVRVRYTGNDLAVIYAIKTLFTISYV